MNSDSDDDVRRGDGVIRCLQISVFVYGIFNLLIRGAELLLAVISTSVILATFVTGIKNSNSYQDYLNQEAKHVIWRGPFNNLLMNLQNVAGMKSDTNQSGNASIISSNLTEMQMVTALDPLDDKLNLHVWSSYFLMKCIVFIFGWLLVSSAKRFSYSGNLAWLSFSIPIFVQYTLQIILDLSLGDYFERELPSQIWQGVDVGFQLLGVILVSIFLRQLYQMDDRIRKIDRYNGFPSSNNADISITEIIDDDQRYK